MLEASYYEEDYEETDQKLGGPWLRKRGRYAAIDESWVGIERAQQAKQDYEQLSHKSYLFNFTSTVVMTIDTSSNFIMRRLRVGAQDKNDTVTQ